MADPTKPHARANQNQKGEIQWKRWAFGAAVIVLLPRPRPAGTLTGAVPTTNGTTALDSPAKEPA